MTEAHLHDPGPQHEYLEAVLSHVSDAVAIVDERGRLQYASPLIRQLAGFEPTDIVGRRALAFVHPSDRPMVLRLFLDAESLGDASASAVRIAQSDGSVGLFELRAARLGSLSDGRGFILSMRDITERNRLEAELSRVQRLESISRLAGAVAHDFNNLLTAIRSYASFAREAIAAGERPDEDLVEILEATNRGESLTRQLLAFARRQVHEPTVLDLGDLLVGLSRLLERLAGEPYRLTFDLPEDLWLVHADSAQLEQCLVNLVMNAVDAMPDGGHIRIVAANLVGGITQGVEPLLCDCVEIAVSDSGPGLAPAAREHLFEPFFTTKELGKGSGLGLAVVYGVIRKHGGRVLAQSELGVGTTMRLVLPRAAVPLEKKEPLPASAPISGVALVVDDDDFVRTVVARGLVAAGLVAHECSSGAEALAAARSLGAELDILITDVVMPQMDGPQIAAQLRREHPRLSVLYITGYGEDMASTIGDLGPADRLLRKPFALGRLAELVAELLSNGRS